MAQSRFVVGIDLGTSNCAMAAAEAADGPDATIVAVAIPQLQRPGELTASPLLPSCIYLPAEHELSPEALRLPWDPAPAYVVGELARWQGARVPGRAVTSAKSWLCHAAVDRCAPILPWGAPAGVPRISPVEASARLLRHLARAWDLEHPAAPLAAQDLVLTVPASFDEAARTLTVDAARAAGLDKFTLVEEPQAAFYDFTARHRRDLARMLEGIRLVLVVDVGGGTTDFTLVRVGTSPDGPLLSRVAVGNHILLGGDNMDAAVGRSAEARMLSAGRALTPGQWTQLSQAARLAKEALLAEGGPEQYRLAVAGEGSRLVGSALTAQLSRLEVERTVLDGFFPACGPEEELHRAPRTGLQELGLPYAQDPAVTRQLAAFLRAHRTAGWAALGESDRASALPRPDAILLNGGVFNSQTLAERLVTVASAWWPGHPAIRILQHDSLDLAVACGAAYYGLVRRGLGRRIGGGTAHAFYVGIEKEGGEQPVALCVIPRGHEEGQAVDLPQVFRLTLGRPVQFPLFTTAADRVEAPGDVVPVNEDLSLLPPIHALLTGAAEAAGAVPVHLRATLTEIGTLALSCVSETSDEQWRLEFELRGGGRTETPAVIQPLPTGFAEAVAGIEQLFGHKQAAQPGGARKQAKQLWGGLERVLGPREKWSLPVLRELWATTFARAGRRRRSPDHERAFFQVLGYTLRPGFGYPLDDWRAEQTAGLFADGVQAVKEAPVWIEFWVMWRRVAGGLSEARQSELWGMLRPHLEYRLSPTRAKHAPKPKGVQPEGLDEMVRLAAALEHLPVAAKVELGGWLAARLSDPAAGGGPWAWALGRLGVRVPLYGSAHRVVPADEVGAWLTALLGAHARGVDGALFAAVQAGRLSGDRARDVAPEQRAAVLAALVAAQAPPAWQRMLEEVAAMDTADEARALGDTLPVGLQLL